MMSLPFGLFTQVSGSGPLGPLVFHHCSVCFPFKDLYTWSFECMIILKIFCPFGRTFVDKSQIVDRYAGYVCFLFQNISVTLFRVRFKYISSTSKLKLHVVYIKLDIKEGRSPGSRLSAGLLI